MMKGCLPEALKMYTIAAESAHEQREIEHICLYEKGVCSCVCSCVYIHVCMCVNISLGMRKVCFYVCACA